MVKCAKCEGTIGFLSQKHPYRHGKKEIFYCGSCNKEFFEEHQTEKDLLRIIIKVLRAISTSLIIIWLTIIALIFAVG